MAQQARSRGFGAMDKELQREIARKGGQAAHQRGTAHEFTSEEASAAARMRGKKKLLQQEQQQTAPSVPTEGVQPGEIQAREEIPGQQTSNRTPNLTAVQGGVSSRADTEQELLKEQEHPFNR